ncbi:alkene reductase [Nocardiopsis sp. NRRL B-16309]|uniref:alkene reductase n=1 Tax=Nocardiopsis sp. NRRL B-16309 TaxID=1519494 RepID=UPI0006AF37C9|nr:alkene reductase [Nocardiopsis sp. NRRL B-16309]KOX24074.1 1,2-oxophytodienoate reductase [Nocardiopsis sp. NRRL B-16309]
MTTLFDPIKLGGLELPNRLFMAPMTRSRAHVGGQVDALVAEYYAQRASAGLIVTEGTQPSVRGQGYINTPGLHSAEQVEAWKRVTGAVHERGGRIFAQIMHTGRIGHPSLYPDGGLPVAPSPIASGESLFDGSGMVEHPVPRELTSSDIAEALDDFASAARNAVTAGFDGVELHGANGYLIHQFLADGANRRTDEYGGSPENRARFALQVVDAVADTIGAERTALRLSPGNPFNGITESDTRTQYIALLDGLKDRSDLAFLHLAMASRETAELFRKEWQGALVHNPAAGLDLAPAVSALEDGVVDAVALGTAWLANPDLLDRVRAGGPFNEPDSGTFYGGDHRGYTDYPALDRA